MSPFFQDWVSKVWIVCLVFGLSGCYLFTTPDPSRISGRIVLLDTSEPLADGAIIIYQERSDFNLPANYDVVQYDTIACDAEGVFDITLEKAEDVVGYFIRAAIFNADRRVYESQISDCTPYNCNSFVFNHEYEDLEVVIYPN